MTAQELRDELHAALGNRSDMTDARYILWLNWALLDVCGFHKRRYFPSRRFHELEGKATFTVPVVSGTVSGAGDGYVDLAAGDSEDDDFYNDMVVELTAYSPSDDDAPDGLLDQKRVITDYANSTNRVTVHTDWDTNPDVSTTYSIYRRIVDISTVVGINPKSSLWAIERLEKVSDGAVLTPQPWDDLVGVDFTQTGEPGSFAHRGDNIIFNTAPESALALRMWYYKYPTLYSTGAMSTESSLPLDWHEVVLQGAIFRGHDRLMEPDRAAEARGRYVDMAVNHMDSFNIERSHFGEGVRIIR